MREAFGTAPFSALNYSSPEGRAELRRALAEYLPRARGVVATEDRVVACAGFSHGFGALCRVLRAGRVERIAMEDPGAPSHRAVA